MNASRRSDKYVLTTVLQCTNYGRHETFIPNELNS